MASIQDVPSELLREIFIPLSDTAKIPFDRNQPPWVLGHVCSQWRAISRSEPQLWGTPVFIPDESQPIILKQSLAALPKFVNISLTVRDMALQSDSQVVELYKYLPRCSELEITIGRDSAQLDPFFRDVPHDAFVNLTKFKLVLLSNTLPDSDDSEYWASMREALSHAKGLSSVTLMSGIMGLMPIASLPIPWRQLKSLILQLPVQFPTLYALLHQCHSLRSLQVVLPSDHGPFAIIPRPDLDSSFNMPHLQSLSITLSGSSWIPNIRWEHMTDLNLSYMEFAPNTLQRSLEQCLNLRKLTFLLTPGFPVRSLSLPLLDTFNFSCSRRGGCSLENLHAPRLQVVKIIEGHALDIPSLINVLSGCSLLEFHYNSTYEPDGNITPFLRDILTSTPTANLMWIPCANFDDSILRDVGDGTLLPKVREFGFIPQSIEAVAYMAKGWIGRINKDPYRNLALKIDASRCRPTSVAGDDIYREFSGLEDVSIRWREPCWNWYMAIITSSSVMEPRIDIPMHIDEPDFDTMFADVL